jgi:hypothetical protein
MEITSASYVVLSLQLVTLLMISYGAYLMRFKRRMRPHALLLASATAVNVVTVVLFMTPRFLNYLPFISTSYLPDQVLIVHHFFSLITLALTLTLVLAWALRGAKSKACLGVRRYGRTLMLATFGSWLVSISLGILVVVLNTAY